MFEFIGVVVVIIFGWAVAKMILQRVFPNYGLKVAERRYMEDPSPINENLYRAARHRLNKRKRD
ncbi:hypothetical protein ACX3YC_20810 [Pseudomonas mohnii]